MHVRQPAPFTPRHLRGGSQGGTKEKDKQRAFARAAKWSKRFIFQKASALAKEPLRSEYEEWSDASRKGILRKAGSK